jgi:hypothetical protein
MTLRGVLPKAFWLKALRRDFFLAKADLARDFLGPGQGEVA